MKNKIFHFVSILILAVISACRSELTPEEIDRIYEDNPAVTHDGLKVYHLGHSLVGKDMPYMLLQLSEPNHSYNSQLGWGATLKSHWEPDIPINGFDSENQAPVYRDVFQAIESQEYDAFVMTEMVEIKDAIRYFDSHKYLSEFAKQISDTSPNTRIYLYETWHQVNDPSGWVNRLDEDLPKYWEDKILHPALSDLDGEVPIYLIPAGQVFSRFFKTIEQLGGVGEISSPEDIFSRKESGELDPIHINDVGSYFVAVIHYAVLYQKNPVGLPYQLKKFDGSSAVAPSAEVAELMQKITWEVVKSYKKTGVH